MKYTAKKLIAFIMVLAMLLEAAPVSVFAESAQPSGKEDTILPAGESEGKQLFDSKEDASVDQESEEASLEGEAEDYILGKDELRVTQLFDKELDALSALCESKPADAKKGGEQTRGGAKSGEKSDEKSGEKKAADAGEKLTGFLAYEIEPTVELDEKQKYTANVTLPAAVEISKEGSVTLQLFHIVKDTAKEITAFDPDLRDGVLYGFSFETEDGFSPFVVKYTVDFVYIEKKTEISIDLGNFQANSNELGQLLYKNSKGLEELAVSDILDFAQDYLQDENVCGEVYTVSLQNGTALSDFDQNFFANSAVSIEGKGIEYGSGKITLLESFDEAKITFASEAGTLELTLENYTAPEKPVVPDDDDGFSYRFFTETATVEEILENCGIISSYYNNVSVSDANLVTVDGDKLTVQNYFGEVVLTLSLSDGTEVEIKLQNPAPIAAGETVTGDDGSFSADAAVPAGTALSVEAAQPTEDEQAAVEAKVEEVLGADAQAPVYFDISLVGPQGEKVEAGAAVTVKTNIALPQEEGKVTKVTSVKVFHVAEDGTVETLDATYALGENGITSVSFKTDGFSVFGISYTVDFVVNGYTFSYPGKIDFNLSQMLTALHTPFSAADVVAIDFSNNNLFRVQKIEGDWIIEGIQSFTTEETMTMTLADGSVFVIQVTDPETTATIDLNVLDGSGHSAACQVFTASVSKAVQNNDQERNATINFDMHFELTEDAFNTLKSASGFPTIVYDLNSYINDPNVPIEEIPSKTQPLYDGDIRIGQVRFENNVMVMTITNLDWLSAQRRFEADFNPTIKIDETKLGTNNDYPFNFPGTTTDNPITIHFKEITFSSQKSVSYQGWQENGTNVVLTEDADGKYRLHYTVTFNNPTELTSLAFTDTMTGHQTLEGNITVTGPNGSTGTVAGSGQSINIDVKNTLGVSTLPKGEYRVTYTTVINKEDLALVGSGNGTLEKNSANWRVNGGKDVTPDPIEITPYKDRPPMTVEKKVNNQTGRNQTGWQYGTQLNYSITYGSAEKDMSNVTIWDYMTDNQKISGSITVTYSNGTTETITPNSQATDTNYSTGNVQLFEYQLKNNAGNGPVTVTYTANVISKEEAIANNIYGTQSVYNQTGAEGVSSETEGKVTFPETPVQNKTVSSALDPVNGKWQLGDTLTYTVTYGSPDIPLDGITISDSMTKLQTLNWPIHIQIGESGYDLPNDSSIVNPNFALGSISYSAEMDWLFNYTFPAGSGYGPATITYTTTLISQEQVRLLNISGDQNVINTFTVNNNPTSTYGRIPTNEPNTVTKSVVNNTTPGSNTWQPGDSLTYTISFSGDRLAGSTITDYATDLQYLTSDIVLTDSADPANTVTISRTDSTYIGSDFLDISYSTESRKLFEYQIPSEWTGPVTATYDMQIIDHTTAADMHLYNLQGVNNSATTDRGGNGGTGKNTDFGEKPQIPQDKQVSPTDNDTGADETTGWQPGQILNYTLTFGDANTKMAGYVLTDSMTNLQHLIVPQTTNGSSATGITVTYYNASNQLVTMEMPSSAIFTLPGENEYDTGLRQLFNFTVPADADKGVVTVTYSTQVVSLAKATELRIFGVQNVENRFTADGETVTTIGDVPFKPDPKPTKRVEPVDDDETTISGNESGTYGWQPGQLLTYTLTFGDEALQMNNKSVYDEMTNTQTLVGDVTVSWGSGADAKSFTMPNNSTQGNNTNGVYWELTQADRTYSSSNLTLFNYTFPDQTANIPGTETPAGVIMGPVTITYQTRVMSAEQAAASGLYGEQPVNNSYTFNNQTAMTTGDVPFVDQQTHIPAIRKTGFVDASGNPVFPTYETADYSSIYQDGQRTIENTSYIVFDPPTGARTNIDLGTGRVRWIMEVAAAEGSVYPLENVTVTDKLSQTQENVGNSYVNLGELYNRGLVKAVQAQVKTQSGEILTPGGDYTIEINGTNINYIFTQINEPVYIALDIYFHTDVVGWYRMANFSYVNGDESTGNTAYIGGDNSNITVTKQGTVVEGTQGRMVKWEVSLNPTYQVLDPDVDEVNFSDILPDGMVMINYSQALLGNVDTDHPTISRTGGGGWNEWNTYPQEAESGSRTNELPVTVVNGEIQEMDVRGYNYNYTTHSTLSATRYDITYYTWVTDEEWESITSSESGSKEYDNTALFTTNGGPSYSQTTTVTIETEDTEYISKKDVSQGTMETVNGEQILKLQGEDLDYIIDVNPHGYIMNNGSPLKLTDRIETSMNLRVPSVRVFKAPDNPVEVTKDNLRDSLGSYNTAVLGQDVTHSIDITYNDDTRMLTFDGIPDGQRYYVVFTAGVRSVGGNEVQTFNNTATLFGSGSYSSTETTKHVSSDFNASARGGMGMMKIDENNVQKGLEGGVFELYEVQTTNVVLTKDGGRPTYTVTDAEGAVKTYRPVQITVGADENGQYISDKKGRILFGSFEFKPNTLYYWVERQAPEGYIADLDVPHHFVLYNTVRDEPETTQDNMYRAWALDNYWESEYGIIVASYAMNATWYATNSQYRSITATKKWEGDSNNLYQLRPTDGVRLSLIQIAADGTRTVLDTKTIRGGNETYWPSYTWNKLPVYDDDGNEYLYTVEEEPVTDYYAEYSDDGQGIKTGTVTIVNRPTPGKTSIEVEKVWKTGGTMPDNITVKLVQIFTDSDGNRIVFNDSQVENMPAGTSLTATLRPDVNGKWAYTWNNLPTRDNRGGTYSYTVVETSNLAEDYTVAYSDGGSGIVKGKITITNILPGSLKITKNVTVNGQPTNGTEADGVYTFNIIDETGKTVKTVSITITNGVAGDLKVDGLAEGFYTVREVMPSNGTVIASGTPKEYSLEVKAGKTAEGEIPVAEFTNNKNTTFLTVKKDWLINSIDWPANAEVTVRLVEVGANGVTTPVTGRADAAITLNEEQQTYTWRDLDPEKTYTVTEDYLPGYVSEVGEVNSRQVVTVTNKEVTQISFQKAWQGTVPSNWVAEVKLVQRERMIVEYGNTVSPTPTFSGDFTYAGQTQYVVDTSSHTFDNLPKYRHDGTTIYEIEYSVEEGEITIGGQDVTGQYIGVLSGAMATGYTITNIPIINIPVEKIWDGGKPEDVASVEVTLYNGASVALHADGTTVEPITLPVGNAWTAVFEDVPSGGNYTVKETKVTFTDGQTITDTAVIATIYGAVEAAKDFSGVSGKTITNTLATVDLPVTKAWSEAGTGMAWPADVASITLQLTEGNPAVDVAGKTLTMTSADAVSGESYYRDQFTGLPKYDRAGNEIVYGLREEEVVSSTGRVYVSDITVNEVSGAVVSFSVANDRVEETQISVTKEWKQSDGTTAKANTNGDTVSFKVMRVVDGTATQYTAFTADDLTVTPSGATVSVSNGIVTLTYNGGWPTVTLNRLLKQVDGENATYYVEETACSQVDPDVDTTYKNTTTHTTASATAADAACVDDTITIVNTDQVQGLKVTKRWLDGFGDPSTTPPVTTVYFKLYAKAQYNDVEYQNENIIGWDSSSYQYKIDYINGAWTIVDFGELPSTISQSGNTYTISSYYIVETSPNENITVAYDLNGTPVSNSSPIPMNSHGLVTITNRDTTIGAKLRVEKVWKDVSGAILQDTTGKTAEIEVRETKHKHKIVVGSTEYEADTGDSIVVTINVPAYAFGPTYSVTDSAGHNYGSGTYSTQEGDSSNDTIVSFSMPSKDVVVDATGGYNWTISVNVTTAPVDPNAPTYEVFDTITLPDNGHWYKTIDVAAGGQYWLVETSPASGYDISYTYTDVTNGDTTETETMTGKVSSGRATVTNQEQGGALKLKKIVTENGSLKGDASGDYWFTLQLLNENGAPEGDPKYIKLYLVGNHIEDYRLMTKAAYLRGDYNNYNTNGETRDGVYFNHAHSEDGWFAILPNLVPGDYWLTELERTDSSIALISDTAGVVDEANRRVKLHVTAGDTNPATNSAAAATFTNNKNTGVIKLTKLVSLNGDAAFTSAQSGVTPADGTYLFTVASSAAPSTVLKYVQITVTNGVAASYKIADVSTAPTDAEWAAISAVNGSWATITGLVTGQSYVITEAAPTNGTTFVSAARGDGNTSAVNSAAVTVVAAHNTADNNSSAAATFTNNKDTLGALKVKKIVQVNGADPTADNWNHVNGAYIFTITGPSGAASTVPKYVLAEVGNGAVFKYYVSNTNHGSTAMDWYNADAPAYVGTDIVDGVTVTDLLPGDYTITETEVSGMTTTVSGGKGGLSNAESRTITVTVTAGDTTAATEASNATFTNSKYVGALQLKKIVQVNGAAPVSGNWNLVNGAYQFSVTGPDDTQETKYVWILVEEGQMSKYWVGHNDDNDFWISDFASISGEWVTIDQFSPGQYTVKELGTGYAWHYYDYGNTGSDNAIFIEKDSPLDGVSLIEVVNGSGTPGSVANKSITLTVAAGNTVSATAQTTFTNNYNEPGALKIKKIVLVDGEDGEGVNWSRVQGAYDFSVTGPSGADPSVTKYVRILVWDGHIAHSSICDNRANLGRTLVYYPDNQTDRWAIVEGLQPGVYTITELGACEAGSGNTASTTPLSGIVLDSISGGNNDANLDNGTVTVTVVAGDTTASSASASATFTNSTPYVKVPFKAKKTLVGGTLAAGDFTFTLTETDSSWAALEGGIRQTATNAAPESGNTYADVVFEDVTFTAAGTYYFIIAETAGDSAGVIYDTHEQKVTVTVTPNANGQLEATKTYTPTFSETGYDASFTNTKASLVLKKIVDADSNAPVNGNAAYTNGTYPFTIVGPSEQNPQTYNVVITMENGAMTSATLNGAAITAETANAAFDAAEGVKLLGLTAGTYTVTEGAWTIAGCANADMYLKNITVSPASTIDLTAKTATVTVADNATVSVEFTNKLEPNVPNLEKQVTNLNDSLDTVAPTFISENPWNKSADYDIGDQVPYRITTYLPSGYYRAQNAYTYVIHDTMNHLEYVSGSGRMYAFVKPDSDGVTGDWYDVTSWFTVNEGAYANGQQTITVYPTDSSDLKSVTSGCQVTNWGADTHGDNYPYKTPVLAASTSIVNADIRYLQFRYKATLQSDANIGSVTGNANTAYLQFSNSPSTTANTASDTNVVYTYKLVVNKTDDNGGALTGAQFQLFKKYLTAPAGVNSTAQTFTGRNINFYGLASTVTSLNMSRLPSDVSDGNYYLVSGTVNGAEHDWTGIDDGYYILVETQAPTGYTGLAEPIGFVISTTLESSVAGFRNGYVNVYPDGKGSLFTNRNLSLTTGITAAIPNTMDEKGNLTVTKRVVGVTATDSDEFTVMVTLTPPSGVVLADSYTTERWIGDGAHTNGSATIDKTNGNVITLTLKADESCKIIGLPAGTTYTVAETNVPTGWGMVGDPVYSDTNNPHAIANGDSDTVTITNANSGSLKITKNVIVNGAAWSNSSAASPADGMYTFTIKQNNTAISGIGKVNGTDITNGQVQITVQNGVSTTVEVTDLPEGDYTITEDTPANGATLTTGNDVSVHVTAGKSGNEVLATGIASFTNNKPYITAHLEVTKAITVNETVDNTKWPNDLTFTFDLAADVNNPTGAAMPSTTTATATKNDLTASFADIAFTAAGTYTFTITEEARPAGAPSYITYDTAPKTVTITVGADANGNLTTPVIRYNGAESLTVNNEYTASGTVPFKAKKTLEGGTLAAGDFTFTLTETDSSWAPLASGGISESVSNVAPISPATYGDVTFTDVAMTDTTTRYFVIKETVPSPADSSIIYDETEHRITVTVTDDGAGHLTATKSPAADSDGYDASFTNTKKGALTITKAVTVNGAAWTNNTASPADGTYTFRITGSNSYTNTGSITVTNGTAVSNIELTGLTPGEYTITEDATGNGTTLTGVTGDGTTGEVTNGVKLTVEAGDTAETNVAAFTNNKPLTSQTPVATKMLNGAAFTGKNSQNQDVTYTFTLKHVTVGGTNESPTYTVDSGDALQTVTTASNGSISFSAIEFTEQGTYIYQIAETGTDSHTMDYADPVYVKIVVTESNGVLTAGTPAYFSDIACTTSASAVFNNIELGELDLSKTVVAAAGSTLPSDSANQQFTFTIELTNANGLPAAVPVTIVNKTTNAEITPETDYTVTSGKITVVLKDNEKAQIKKLPVGTTYSITEATAAGYTLTWDTTNGASGTISTTTSQADATNTFTSAEYTPLVSKKLNGVAFNGKLGDGTTAAAFTFDLKEMTVSGEPGSETYSVADTAIQTKPTNESGTAAFDAIKYNTPGTYYYQITEQGTDTATMDYDGKAVYLKVVVDNDLQTVTGTYWLDQACTASSAGNAATFENTELTEIEAKKTWGGSAEATDWPAGMSVTFQINQYKGETEQDGFTTAAAANGNDTSVTISSQETKTWTNLPKYYLDEQNQVQPYTYKVVETAMLDNNTALTDYRTFYTVTGEGPGENGLVTIDNTPKTISIKVTKQWTRNNVSVTDKESISYALYKAGSENQITVNQDQLRANNGSAVVGQIKYESNSWQTITISNLPMYERVVTTEDETTTVTYCLISYYVVETDAAADAGYVLATEYSTDGGTTKTTDIGAAVNTNNATITIINTETAGVELPSTGGTGTLPYTLTGLTLLLGASLWLLRRRREQN